MCGFFFVLFWGPFWNPFWTPKLVQNLLIFGSILDPFFWGFRSSLGASWEPSWASWGSLGRPQERKNADSPTRKPLVWKCSFLGLWSSWWPSWAHLAPSLADQFRKWVPKWSPKGVQKVTKKWSTNHPKWSKKWSMKSFNLGPRMTKNRSDPNFLGHVSGGEPGNLKSRCQDGPKDGPR